MISYARQLVTAADRAAVLRVLRSSHLTQGPAVARFEEAMAAACGARYAVAVHSGTAALHLCCLAAGLERGDRHWTSAVSFVASANCGIYCGSRPGFIDIDADEYNLSTGRLEEQLRRAARQRRLPKVLIPVHLAGLPCAMPDISRLAARYGITVIEDACHAPGATYRHGRAWQRVGSCRDSSMTVFSFHAVKNIAAGEGGMILTNDRRAYARLLRLRTHGIVRDGLRGLPYYYEMRELGFNYRLSDLHAALGHSQLQRLTQSNRERARQAARYRSALHPAIGRQATPGDRRSAWHLFLITVPQRDRLYRALAAAGICANLHYIPIHRHPYYRQHYPQPSGAYPQAERLYRQALTLPLYPGLRRSEQERVISVVNSHAERWC